MDAEAYADMFPWILFIVVDRKTGLDVTWAAGCAGVCSLGLLAWSYWRGTRSVLPRIGVALFGSFFFFALTNAWWNTGIGVPRTVAVGVLGVAALASLRWTPLSEAYTASLVAPALRQDPRFHRANFDMTCAWGAAAALVAVSCGTAALIHDAYGFTFLGWVTPLVFAGGAILWTSRRWDLFRVAVDSSATGGGARGPIVSLVVDHFDDEALGYGAGADIRELPVRKQRNA
jgi:hypothetical protein